MPLQLFRARTAGVLLAAVFAASCADSPSQTAGPRITAKLEIVAGNGQTGAPGEELANPVTVRALDSIGQPVPGQIINFRVVQGGGSVFAGANVTDANGMALEYWTLGPRAGDAQTLEARAVDNATGAKIVFGTFTATSVGSTPGWIQIGSLPEMGAVGQTVANPIDAIVRDAFQNAVANAQVTWTVFQGNGRFTNAAGVHGSTAVSTTNAQGVATIKFTPGTTAGINAIRATAGSVQDADSMVGLAGVPVRFTISPSSLTLPVNGTGKFTGFGYDRWNNQTVQRPTWRSLDAGIVTVLSPTSTRADSVATVRGNAVGTGRVVGQFNTGSKVYADTAEVTVQ
ncbi:MAG TPA: hypothetical protein VE871_12460 [Longimicrobium sp.]|nr:hypothetical protein [Longimicrobium sp.]